MKLLVTSRLPSDWGEYSMSAFGEEGDHQPHVVLFRGLDELKAQGRPVLLRIHSECMTGDVFASNRCDCGQQLHMALHHFKEHGGMLIYLRQEGRGIGLVEKLRAYNLQEGGMDTFEANVALGHGEDDRLYGDAVAILKHFGLDRVRLMTNNPLKEQALSDMGIEVTECVPVVVPEHPDNEAYFRAKREIAGHRIPR